MMGEQNGKNRPFGRFHGANSPRGLKDPLWKKSVRWRKDLNKQLKKHEGRYKRTAETSLDFKSPDQVVAEYFSKYNICLDS